MKRHHDRIYVIEMEALDFCEMAIGSVRCYNSIPPEFLVKIVDIRSSKDPILLQRKKKQTRARNVRGILSPRKVEGDSEHELDFLSLGTELEFVLFVFLMCLLQSTCVFLSAARAL